MLIELEDTARNAGFIDTRVEINIIMLNLARRTKFPIRDEFRFINIISQINHFRGFYRVVEKVPIKIGSVINTIPI